MARLAGGVVLADGQAAWALGTDGLPVRLGRSADGAAGLPVAVGPAEASDVALKAALQELDWLVADGGAAAAGAGVYLGREFTSALLVGAPGERRDWVLAALKALWPDGADRLGERMAVAVALFGPRATKRLGAALTRAAGDGRWAAIHYAVAASDLLGPEKLERLLALEAPEDVDPVPGGEPSVLGSYLAEALRPLPEARRLTLLQSLWDGVVAAQAAEVAACRIRRQLVTDLDGVDGLQSIAARRAQVEDDWLLAVVERYYGHPPTLGEAARWLPFLEDATAAMLRLLEDALASIALARAAAAAAAAPLEAAVAEHLDLLIQGACPGITGSARSQLRRLRGPMPEAGRPGHVAAEIAAAAILAAQPDAPRAAQIRRSVLRRGGLEDYVRPRLATAWAHAAVTLRRVPDQLGDHGPYVGPEWEGLTKKLRSWRRVAGFGDDRPPQDWHYPPHRSTDPPLAERIAAQPSRPADEIETAQDLLWYADLADAVASLSGHAAATITVEWGRLTIDPFPDPKPEPLRPPADSIPAAAAGAAQLVCLGAEVPPRPVSWDDLAERLLASARIAELLVSDFAVPAEVLALDGAALAGTDLVVEIARTARQLADWAMAMANCIASYVDEGSRGSSLLIALRPPAGLVRYNAELRRSKGGWRIVQFFGRFNTEPPAEIESALRAWVADLPGPEAARPPAASTTTPPAPRRPGRGRGGPARRGRPTQAVLAARAVLADACAARVDPVLAAAVAPLGARLGWHADGDAFGALTVLRRTPLPRLAETVGEALADGHAPADLWAVTGHRPLAAAVATLDGEQRHLLHDVDSLLGDGPLPAGARPLARLAPVARARTVEVGLRRVRAAVGVLLCQADERLDSAMAAHPALGPLCAGVLALTAWSGSGDAVDRLTEPVVLTDAARVPGVPASGLLDGDGPWSSAWSGAADLGAPVEALRARIEAGDLTALLVPSAWAGRRGWPALWGRAHRQSRSRR